MCGSKLNLIRAHHRAQLARKLLYIVPVGLAHQLGFACPNAPGVCASGRPFVCSDRANRPIWCRRLCAGLVLPTPRGGRASRACMQPLQLLACLAVLLLSAEGALAPCLFCTSSKEAPPTSKHLHCTEHVFSQIFPQCKGNWNA